MPDGPAHLRGRQRVASAAAGAVVTGTARMSPIDPTSIAITCSATALRLFVSANSVPAIPKTSKIASEEPA